MARSSRNDSDGSWHHLTNRGVRRLPLFGSDIDRTVFLSYLSDMNRDYGLETHAFCLMDNHYHLMACSTKGNLSEAMRTLGGRYGRYFNHKHGYSGAVFQSRFFSDPIYQDESLLQLSRYIHLNPTEVHPDKPPSENLWSSYGCYLGRRPTPRWLQTRIVLSLANGPEKYAQFVESDLTLAAPTIGETSIQGEPDPDRLLNQIDREVAAAYDIMPVQVLMHRRGVTNQPRLVAALLATTHPGIPSEQVATHYGFSSVDGARRTSGRFRNSLTTDSTTARLVTELMQVCLDLNLS